MRSERGNRRGQAVVMVTLVLFAMVGMLGLAVDLGWSYFVKKSEQAAADAAALAAVYQAYLSEDEEDGNTTYDCGAEVACSAMLECPQPVPSPPSNNLEHGCLYAEANGYATGGEGGRQKVTIQADSTPTPPTAPGVKVHYWATVRIAESIPQLFSSILGNRVGLSTARSTAAIVDSTILGSLILLNRENDCVAMGTSQQQICGVNLLVQANNNQGLDSVRADGGILMASTKHGETADGRWAGENRGGGTVRGPFTYIRGAGDVMLQGSSTWIQDPENGYADRWYFKDPMRGKGQPPPPSGLIDRPVIGGTISGSNNAGNPLVLQPGNYYAAAYDRQGRLVATGGQISLTGHIRFSSGGSGFGNYVFFGGLENHNAGTVVTLEPGRYIFAGVKEKSGRPAPLFDVQKNMTIQDLTSGVGPNSDAGEILIFTDPYYPGLEIPAAVQEVAGQLKHGVSGFQTGNNSDIYINIHGLNRDSAALPQELKDFSPVILWQDQRNSIIKYTEDGYIDTSCGNDASRGCPNTALSDERSVEMYFKASPNLHIYGTAYQPRGAFTSLVGGGGYDSPLQLIAGALHVHANSNVRLQPIRNPLLVKMVSLVE